MQEALYHPQFGYYARQVQTVGRTGDFSTAATLHPALGEAIAAWAASHRAEVARAGRWHLVELGGGTGELAASVLNSLSWWQRLGLTYHLVEVSEGLRARQQKLLGTTGKVRWHDDVASALAVADGRAHLFSNEFVDAFPCVQLAQAAPGEWREVRVVWPENQDHPHESTASWNGPSPSAAADQTLPVGQHVEVHLSYRKWLASLPPTWQAGRLLTIDYGDILPALYHRRPGGTLRAYCRHQRFTGPGSLPPLRAAGPDGGRELHRSPDLGRGTRLVCGGLFDPSRFLAALVVCPQAGPVRARSPVCVPARPAGRRRGIQGLGAAPKQMIFLRQIGE